MEGVFPFSLNCHSEVIYYNLPHSIVFCGQLCSLHLLYLPHARIVSSPDLVKGNVPIQDSGFLNFSPYSTANEPHDLG